jgi:hypothetical protein
MAFSATLLEQGPLGGNMNFRIYQLTDVQNTGSALTVKGWREVVYAEANNATDTDERIFASIGAGPTNVVTFDCVTSNDDGFAFLIGR